MKGIRERAPRSDNSVSADKIFLQSVSVSIIGIILCIISLCSASWAWFSTSISSPPSNIYAASCDITVAVKSADGGAEVDGVDGKYALEGNHDYVVTLTAEGSAKQAYCIFVVGGKKYYTEQISTAAPDNTITFNLMFDTETEVEIVNRWGISSRQERELYDDCSYLNMVENAPESASQEENEQNVID